MHQDIFGPEAKPERSEVLNLSKCVLS